MRHVRRSWRRPVAAALSLLALTLATGCGNPAGVDGDLTDSWAAIGAPAGFTPSAGTCHLANFAVFGARDRYEEVDCRLRHRSETVYVGTYPTPAADAADPPAQNSAGARSAYEACDAKTAAYVGGPWRTARLWAGVTQPTRAAWAGGARWYRCEVVVSSSVEDDGGLVQRVGTLRNSLDDGASPLLLTCYGVLLNTEGKISTMPAEPCATKHNAEFVGIWDAGERGYPQTAGQWDEFHDGCRSKIASYVGVPDDADLEFRAGVISLPGGDDVWELGDRQVRCYLWLDAKTLTASLKGKGSRALPIQYQ